MAEKEQIIETNDALLIRAPAKINLSLLISGKRPDGFYEIETVMAKINFFDEILIEPRQKSGIELICQGPCWAPNGRENLIYQACELMFEKCGRRADVKLTLTKNIPAGSGLGSASSDAAATLTGLNRFLKLAIGPPKLAEMAAALGSDVTFFLGGPMALCTGKGEKIKKLDTIFDFLAILALPDVNVSTKRVYENYRHDAPLYEQLKRTIGDLTGKNSIDLMAKMCANMLANSCFHLNKELAELKENIEALGLRPLCLSGSGSAMFYIIDDQNEEKAERFRCEIAKKIGCKSVIVSNIGW